MNYICLWGKKISATPANHGTLTRRSPKNISAGDRNSKSSGKLLWLPSPYILGPILPLPGGRPPRRESKKRVKSLPGRTGRLKLGLKAEGRQDLTLLKKDGEGEAAALGGEGSCSKNTR